MIPDKIYLQIQDEDDNRIEAVYECTWHSDTVYDTDIEYIRSDLVTEKIKELENKIYEFECAESLAKEAIKQLNDKLDKINMEE